MTNRTHLLEIYDLEDYNGPNPLHVVGVGMVKGPENSRYYILEPLEPVYCGKTLTSQLAVRPHYESDAPTKVTDSICTVGIAVAKPGVTYETDGTYGFADFCFWKVGKIHPTNGA